MSRRTRTVDEWRREVFRSTALSDRAKVLLLFLADEMGAGRKVSIPRKRMADRLGKTERRITERITEAHRVGFLSTVSAGYVGRTAVYQGTFPDAESGRTSRPLPTPESGTPTSPLSSAETRPLSTPERGRTSRPPLLERTVEVPPADRDDSSNEEPCRFHGWSSCPADCLDHPTNRRTA